MPKKKLISRFVYSLLIGVILFALSAPYASAKADDLVITDDGEIILYITTLADNYILGTTIALDNRTPASPPKTQPKKEVLVPAHTPSTISIKPSKTDDKKVTVTINTGQPTNNNPTTPAPITSQVGQPNNSKTTPQLPATTTPASPSINKVVDQVVAQGSTGQPILSINSQAKNNLNLQQGNTIVSTSLPIQMDNVTHKISVVTPNGPTNIAVLPREAVTGAMTKGLFNNSYNLNINLSQEQSQVNYTLKGEKEGRLLGLFYVKSPVEVKLSAQTGKIASVNQSPLFSVFGFLIR